MPVIGDLGLLSVLFKHSSPLTLYSDLTPSSHPIINMSTEKLKWVLLRDDFRMNSYTYASLLFSFIITFSPLSYGSVFTHFHCSFPIKHTHMYAYSYLCVSTCTFILIPFSCCVPNFMLPPSLNTNTIVWIIRALTSNWP